MNAQTDRAVLRDAPLIRRAGRLRARPRPWQLCVLWLALMTPLATWGLPSRQYDDLLFGTDVWAPEQFQAGEALAALRGRTTGADTDLNPLDAAPRLIDLTATPAGRAEILTRYRLYSRQPDEMITFRALARMNPRELNLDPQLYQYGGLYVYLAGGAVAFAALCGFTQLTSDLNVYLASPELFGRFYVVTRGISLLAGALALAAVFRLAARAGGRRSGWLAMLLVALSPVFITFALEAKPHLPATCALLWAALAGLEFDRRARRGDGLRLGVFSGVSAALVLTGFVAALVWIPLLLKDARSRAARLVWVAWLAVAIYIVTNPYIVYNALFRRDALSSNLANSTDMYRVGRFAEGFVVVARLLNESVGLGTLVMGLIAAAWLLRRAPRPTLIAAAAGVGMLAICVALGAGKPAEFARFLLLPALLLCVSAAIGVVHAARRSVMAGVAMLIGIGATLGARPYLASFVHDTRGDAEARIAAGRYLREHAGVDEVIGVTQVPAPYSVPPLDFAHRRVVLLPNAAPDALSATALPRWVVITADDESRFAGQWWGSFYRLDRRFPPPPGGLTPISWANKATFVLMRREN
ncbi:MAG: glycosyltransferase family 39 protein [Phycisphaerae bacterium]